MVLRGQPGKTGGSGRGPHPALLGTPIPALPGHLFQLQCVHLSKHFGNGVYGTNLYVKWDLL